MSEVVDSQWYGGANAKFPHRFIQYLVSWEGYGPEGNSWKPSKMLQGTAIKGLGSFHKRYASKPKDHRLKVEWNTRLDR